VRETAAACVCARVTHSSSVDADRGDGGDRGRPTDHRVGTATVAGGTTTKVLMGLSTAVNTTTPAAALG